MKYLCKRGGSSGAGSRRAAAPQQQATPSGVTYDQFMQMSADERYDLINTVLNNPNIKVPRELDNSETSKVMYALGMNNKPKVVSESVLDTLPGVVNYRTVADAFNPPPYSRDILKQIKTDDFTQLSGSGGSLHGRALYFANNYFQSTLYGHGQSSVVMRMKINSSANIVTEQTLLKQMKADKSFMKKTKKVSSEDRISMYALSHGVDGWNDPSTGYTMLLNRGAMTVSSANKWVYDRNGGAFFDWASAPNA